jgi:hypothetical protein
MVTPPAQETEDANDFDSPFTPTDFDDDDDDTVSPMTAPMMPQPSAMGNKNTGVTLSRMTEDDRRAAITRVFQLVLGRDPVDRDFSYYRFSTLTEESLVKSILGLPEHKQILDKAREFQQLKQTVSTLDLQVKQLIESQQSMVQEQQTMRNLLAEKNRYIQQMRGIPEGEQVIVPPKVEPVNATIKSGNLPLLQAVETKKLATPVDEMRSMIKGLFGKR